MNQKTLSKYLLFLLNKWYILESKYVISIISNSFAVVGSSNAPAFGDIRRPTALEHLNGGLK